MLLQLPSSSSSSSTSSSSSLSSIPGNWSEAILSQQPRAWGAVSAEWREIETTEGFNRWFVIIINITTTTIIIIALIVAIIVIITVVVMWNIVNSVVVDSQFSILRSNNFLQHRVGQMIEQTGCFYSNLNFNYWLNIMPIGFRWNDLQKPRHIQPTHRVLSRSHEDKCLAQILYGSNSLSHLEKD